MESIFYTPARILFNIQCYHMETKTKIVNVDEGNADNADNAGNAGNTGYSGNASGVMKKTRTETKDVRVNTFFNTTPFKYMSWRDVSGRFDLDISEFKKDPNKALIKLKLTVCNEFADDGTQSDFNAQKQYFINNNNKDQLYDFTLDETLPNLHTYNLVKLSEEGNHNISLCHFILATFLGVVEFYKTYLDSYCITQSFVIRKLISTKQNLNLDSNFKPFFNRLPTVVINKSEVVFNDQSKLGVVTVVPDLPSFDELVEKGNRDNMKKKSSDKVNDGKMDVKVEYPTFNEITYNNNNTNHVDSTDKININNNVNTNFNVNANINNNPSNENLNHLDDEHSTPLLEK